jgi:hypothetical protein
MHSIETEGAAVRRSRPSAAPPLAGRRPQSAVRLTAPPEGEHLGSEIYRYAFAFPVAEAGGFGAFGAAEFGQAFGFRGLGGAALGRLFQGAEGGRAELLAWSGVGRKVLAHERDLRLRTAPRQPRGVASPLALGRG